MLICILLTTVATIVILLLMKVSSLVMHSTSKNLQNNYDALQNKFYIVIILLSESLSLLHLKFL